MFLAQTVRRAACLVVLALASAAAATTGASSLRQFASQVGQPSSATLAELIASLAAAVGCLAALGLTGCGVAVVVSGRHPTSTVGRAIVVLVPSWWRRALLLACGVTLATPGLASAAGGSAPHAHASDTSCSPPCVAVVRLDGLPLPELPTARDPGGQSIVVAPGDSLWRIAAERLGSDAGDAEILDLVERTYRANRAAVGGDPDLIFPGTLLTVPGGIR